MRVTEVPGGLVGVPESTVRQFALESAFEAELEPVFDLTGDPTVDSDILGILHGPSAARLLPVRREKSEAIDGASLIGPNRVTVQDVFREFGQPYHECLEAEHRVLAIEQAKAMQSILLCKTAELGYHQWLCSECGSTATTFNACQNRHCPGCMFHLGQQWCRTRERDLLSTDYYHVVLTVPHEVNAWLDPYVNRRVIYGILFDSVRRALLRSARRWEHWEADIGVLAVLHTWNQVLKDHLHVHCLVPGAGWSVTDPERPAHCPKGTLLPKHLLMREFREAFVGGLRREYDAGNLIAMGQTNQLADPDQFTRWLDRLAGRQWVLEIKPPILPANVTLAYLARYTQQAVIGNSRILGIDEQAGTVTFSYRDNHGQKHEWGEQSERIISGVEFIDLFLRHIIPHRFMRIRNWGFWSSRTRGTKLERLRVALGGAPSDEVEEEPAAESDEERDDAAKEDRRVVRICPTCKLKTFELILRTGRTTIGRMMDIECWPGRDGWGIAGWKPDRKPEEVQQILPGCGRHLPGGADYLKSSAAGRDRSSGHGSRDSSALGFT